MSRFRRLLFGWKPLGDDSRPGNVSARRGSNLRRLATRASWVVILSIMLQRDVFFPYPNSVAANILIVFVVTWSIYYFVFVVAVIPFLTSEKFVPKASRLFSDGCASALQIIAAFGLLYMWLGIEPECGLQTLDHFYFSAVTFSTLGYGDFAPAHDAKLLAAFQAIIGNLHLGIIVGSVFFAAVEVQMKRE